jgi:uncharacterized damage-inducible protein DinB
MSNLEYEKDLYETRNDLVKEITLLSYDDFNNRCDTNKWSIAQVCHHLILVEKASTKVIAWGLKESTNTEKERKDVQLMLDRTKKLKAPKIVEPDAEPFEVQQIINMLNDSRTNLMTLLSTVEDKTILMKKSVKHPAFDELPLDQWIEQIYLHEQRHIEQIKELK